MEKEEIGRAVREHYGNIAKQGSSCRGSAGLVQDISKHIGYSQEELNTIPEGANLGLGLGNPLALALLKEGEAILHLGSDTGFHCFLAVQQVGNTGKVIWWI